MFVTPIGNADPLGRPNVCTKVTTPGQLSDATGAVHETTAEQTPGSLFTITFEGQEEYTGAWASLTVTVNVQIVLLPAASVAVYVMVVTPTGKADPEANPPVWVKEVTPQLSVADGAIQVPMAEHVPGSLFKTILAGHDVKNGAWLSVTITSNEHVDEFPAASVAVKVIIVIPTGNVEPDGKPDVCTIETPGQLSEADGAIHDTIALHKPGLLLEIISNGQLVNNGDSPSVTVTLNEHVTEFPPASRAVYTMFVVPNGNNDPLGNPAVCVIITPAQLSFAVGAIQLTTAPQEPASFDALMFEGHVTKTGGWLSFIVTLNEHVDVFPLPSVAVNATKVTPNGNADPEGNPLVWTIETTPKQLSVAAGGDHVATALHKPGVVVSVMFAGQDVNNGTSLSATITSKVQMVVFPLTSVAVKEIFVVPIGKVDPLTGPTVCVTTTPGQLSVAPGAAQLTTAEQTPGDVLVFIVAGHDVNTGNWLSITVTVNEQVAVFPPASEATNVTTVTPIGNADPFGNPVVWLITKPGQLSIAVGAIHPAMALHKPILLFNTIFTGHEVNTGTSLSFTVTVNEQSVIFPLASVAVYVMLVPPIGNADPEGNPAVCVTINPGQLSVATGNTHETFALHDPGELLTVILVGHEVNVGNWLSITVTVNVHNVVLPLASVAVNVTVDVPIGKADPLGSPDVCTTPMPGQLSVATGATQPTTELHKPGVLLTVMFVGHEVKVGAWLSVIVMLNEHVAEFPLASVAINVTNVTPTGKVEPDGNPLVCVITDPAQLSVAVGATQLTTAPHMPGVLVVVTFTGHEVKTGNSLSVTETVNAQVAVLPLASVAVYDMLVTPIGNVDPDGKPAVCVNANPAQLSLAVGAAQNTIAPHVPGVLFTLIFAGQLVNTGTWLSNTVTVNEQVVALLLASVAIYVMLVTPIRNDEPEGNPRVWTRVMPAQLSLAAGATQLTTALQLPGVLLTVILPGHDVNVGNWLSTTVTVNVHELVLP
jgi:hypothetical protein